MADGVDFSPFAWGAGLFAGFVVPFERVAPSLCLFFVFITQYNSTRNVIGQFSRYFTCILIHIESFRTNMLITRD